MKIKTYKISEVAEILGVHPDTIRNWEDEGLITPDRIGTRGDRRYTIEHIQEIKDKNLISNLAKKNVNKRDYSNLSKEDLIKEIQILKNQKSFGIAWEDEKNREKIIEECKTKAPILKPREKYRIEDKKGDSKKPKHILIQGDNYHALKVLNYTHKNKIDVIYIDPPYNTGNKDFIYNDSFIDKEDSYRHSKWLSFMKHRLVLARELLKDSGVIFISIDDNEQARLKLLCDEIFGEENFISNIIWRKKRGGGRGNSLIIPQTEYILVYSKKIENVNPFTQKISEHKISAFKYKDKLGFYKREGLDHHSPKGAYERKTLQYKMIIDGKEIYCPTGQWLWSKDRVQEELKNIIDEKDGIKIYKNIEIVLDRYSRYRAFKKIRLEIDGEDRDETLLSIIDYPNITNNSSANDIIDIFGEAVFSYSKPKDLLNYLLKSISNKEIKVLDFFAGSGTTGHAVLELNKDGGNRQVILCTNNENGIAEKVTFERMKRVMKGYENKKKEKVAGLGGELEYFETELVDVENMNRVDDKRKLAFTLEAGWVIATKENTFNEIEKNDSYQIFEGVENIKGKSVSKTVAIYFKENLDKLKELENKILKKENVKLYIFSHFTNEFVSEYADYKNVKVCDIPEPILKVYKGFNNS